jgi:hypothetical protein
MYAPTARRTPTQLPVLGWTLAIALLLMGTLAPALAAGGPARAAAVLPRPLDTDQGYLAGWRLLSFDEAWRRTVHARGRGATAGMLPLAVLPSQRSALWFGLSASGDAGARVELRWTMPLDDRPAMTRLRGE